MLPLEGREGTQIHRRQPAAPHRLGKHLLNHERVQPARPGRPAGKRTDPKYTQITAYIRKATHQAFGAWEK